MFELYKKIANLVGGRERERDKPSRLGIVAKVLQFKDVKRVRIQAPDAVADFFDHAELHVSAEFKCPGTILDAFAIDEDVVHCHTIGVHNIHIAW